jgi:hypothetical protein
VIRHTCDSDLIRDWAYKCLESGPLAEVFHCVRYVYQRMLQGMRYNRKAVQYTWRWTRLHPKGPVRGADQCIRSWRVYCTY